MKILNKIKEDYYNFMRLPMNKKVNKNYVGVSIMWDYIEKAIELQKEKDIENFKRLVNRSNNNKELINKINDLK
jgi:hypothetical protein